MVIDNWINLVAAILVGGGTLVLAVMAYRAIRQTRAIQKTEKREGLLNEVIEWAVAYSTCCKIETGTVLERPSVGLAVTHQARGFSQMLVSLGAMKVRTDYIEQIGLRKFGHEIDLVGAINNAKTNLEEYTGLIESRLQETEQGRISEPSESVKIHRERFTEYGTKVLLEAAKIKTRDIGKEEHMSKKEETTGSNEPTLKDIDDHLRRQDKKLENGTYFSGYLFGATLIFIAFGLLAGKYIFTTEFWYVTYCIVMLIGGTGLIGFAWYKRMNPPK